MSKTFTDYSNFAVNAELYLYDVWVYQYNAPSCVKNTILKDYYNLKAQIDNTASCPVYTMH